MIRNVFGNNHDEEREIEFIFVNWSKIASHQQAFWWEESDFRLVTNGLASAIQNFATLFSLFYNGIARATGIKFGITQAALRVGPRWAITNPPHPFSSLLFFIPKKPRSADNASFASQWITGHSRRFGRGGGKRTAWLPNSFSSLELATVSFPAMELLGESAEIEAITATIISATIANWIVTEALVEAHFCGHRSVISGLVERKPKTDFPLRTTKPQTKVRNFIMLKKQCFLKIQDFWTFSAWKTIRNLT